MRVAFPAPGRLSLHTALILALLVVTSSALAQDAPPLKTAGSYILKPEEGLMPEFGSEIKAGAAHSDGAYTFTVTEKGDWGSPIHTHRTRDVMLYVLEGALSLYLDGETHELEPGAFARIERGSPHALGYYSEERTRVIHVFIPGGWEEFWLENSLLGIRSDEEDMPHEEYRRQLIEIAERYETEFVAPNPFRDRD